MHIYRSHFIDYYKTLFDFQYYDYLTRYNNYYLSGLNNKECPVKEEPEFKKEQLPAFEKIILPDFKFPLLHNYFEPFTQSTTDNENENENAEDYIRKDIDYINSINNERPSLNNSFI